MTPRKINEAVARKLGWRYHKKLKPVCWQVPEPGKVYLAQLPDYCRSIAAAWKICESINTPYVLVQQEVKLVARQYEFKDGMCAPFEFTIRQGAQWLRGEADTAPMAICLAFLKKP